MGFLETLFQFHKVRLKVLNKFRNTKLRHVSIPQGTIKSRVAFMVNFVIVVSIPQGTIKRKFKTICNYLPFPFQFHKVRLKVYIMQYVIIVLVMFQFHKVRLKGTSNKTAPLNEQVSIPQGTIKSH